MSATRRLREIRANDVRNGPRPCKPALEVFVRGVVSRAWCSVLLGAVARRVELDSLLAQR